jgi:class 3 adenylate cyclase
VVAIPEVHYARDECGAIAYQVWGAGAVDLLVMTEWPTSVDNIWEHPARVRHLGFHGSLGRVLRFDCRGLGASDPVPIDRIGDLDHWARDIGLVLDTVGVDRAVVSAEGFAGQAAMVFAAQCPERVERLALPNSFARQVPDDAVDGILEAAIPIVREQWGSGALTRSAATSLAQGADPGFFGRTERLGASPMVAAAMVEATYRSDVRAMLPTISAPTLVLYTGDLAYATVEHSEYLAAQIPNARLVHAQSSAFFWGDAGFTEYGEFLAGRQPDESERLLATVVFTDVVGSTELAAKIGNSRWNEIFLNLDRFVQIQVERFGGRIVQRTGDGHLLTFPTPRTAIDATLAILDASLDVTLRAGMHTGEVELRPTGDIAGLAVHVAARVAGLAGAGELVVSRTVADLMAGSETRFEDRGEHQLKGVPGDWRIFAIAR